MTTYHAKPGEVDRRWIVVDATDQVLGRLSSRVAAILRGKNKPQYTPHCDVGDFVIVVNAERIRLTGGKEYKKQYFSHSGYPGGARLASYTDVQKKHPERIIQRAVKGMLPRTRLGRRQLGKLKVYTGADYPDPPYHPHIAQQPEKIEI